METGDTASHILLDLSAAFDNISDPTLMEYHYKPHPFGQPDSLHLGNCQTHWKSSTRILSQFHAAQHPHALLTSIISILRIKVISYTDDTQLILSLSDKTLNTQTIFFACIPVECEILLYTLHSLSTQDHQFNVQLEFYLKFSLLDLSIFNSSHLVFHHKLNY